MQLELVLVQASVSLAPASEPHSHKYQQQQEQPRILRERNSQSVEYYLGAYGGSHGHKLRVSTHCHVDADYHLAPKITHPGRGGTVFKYAILV